MGDRWCDSVEAWSTAQCSLEELSEWIKLTGLTQPTDRQLYLLPSSLAWLQITLLHTGDDGIERWRKSLHSGERETERGGESRKGERERER